MKMSVTLVVAVVLIAGGRAEMPPQRPPAAAQSRCAPADATVTWLRRVLTGWAAVRRDALKRPGAAVSPMVFYDEHCAYTVDVGDARGSDGAPARLSFDGAPVTVRSHAHGGQVALPDGSRVSAEAPVARATMLSDTAAFFVMATPDLWRRLPAFAQNPDTERFFLGVAMHELAHTEHLPYVLPRLKALAEEVGLTSVTLDDDVIQTTFGERPGFRDAFEAERDALYDAVNAPDAATRRALLSRALRLAAARRAHFFTGAERHYQRFEDEFLSLEGAGQWAAYRFALLDRPDRSPADAVAFVRDRRTYWSQEEGLALFLLLDLEVPHWQQRVFGANDPGPFALLADVLAQR